MGHPPPTASLSRKYAPVRHAFAPIRHRFAHSAPSAPVPHEQLRGLAASFPAGRLRLPADGVPLHAARVRRGRSTPSGSRATALTRPSDHGSVTVTSWPRRRSSSATSSAQRDSTPSAPRLRLARVERAGKWSVWNVGASIAACRSSPEDDVARGRAGATTGPAGRRPASRTPAPARRRAARASARASSAAGAPGASEAGSPSSSQNICARVPSGKPSAGITGEDCSQPPLGVAETRLPEAVGDVEVDRCRRASARRRRPSRPRRDRALGSRPPSPGRSSPDAVSPTSRRRSSAYSRDRSRSSGTSAGRRRTPRGRRRRASRTRRPRGRTRRPDSCREVEAVEQRELLEEHRALAPRARLADREPAEVERRGGSSVGCHTARSPPAIRPPFSAEKRSISSATNPS